MLHRRTLLTAVAGFPLAAVLANPKLLHAAAGSLQNVTITTKSGQTVAAALALPDAVKAPAVMLVHEWWGLNDQIKAVAAQFAAEGYLALAIDLYKGKVATAPADARGYMQAVARDAALETVAGWAEWLQGHARSSGKIGTIGWCFGGGWSLAASLAAPVDATIVYYGNVARSAEQLAALKGPVLGHFASRDKWINKDMVGKFEKQMDKAGKSYTTHWYEADHAFANPTQSRYDEADAKLSWSRSLAFFNQHLKG